MGRKASCELLEGHFRRRRLLVISSMVQPLYYLLYRHTPITLRYSHQPQRVCQRVSNFFFLASSSIKLQNWCTHQVNSDGYESTLDRRQRRRQHRADQVSPKARSHVDFLRTDPLRLQLWVCRSAFFAAREVERQDEFVQQNRPRLNRGLSE